MTRYCVVWGDVCCITFMVHSPWRGGASLVIVKGHSPCCVCNSVGSLGLHSYVQEFNSSAQYAIYTLYTQPLPVRAVYRRSWLNTYHLFEWQLNIWTVVCLTVPKFKPLIFPCWPSPCPILWTFSLSWFCMTSACCLHNFVIKSYTYAILKAKSRFAPWKIANSAENLVLQALQFQMMGVCRRLPGGAVISHYRPNKFFIEC